ncbi:Thiamine Transporter Slc35F3-Like [Manis pentadactyla]|nr:Thiamine Transporter Slc35F3-Like [Manis pentadactyla]
MHSPAWRRRGFSKPGSPQTPLSSWKRLPLFSETLGPLAVAPPRLPFRSIKLAERLGLHRSDERPANGGPALPPRPQNKTRRALDTAPSCEK